MGKLILAQKLDSSHDLPQALLLAKIYNAIFTDLYDLRLFSYAKLFKIDAGSI